MAYNKKIYQIWYQMIYRCENPKCKNFKHYGARGIRVCESWHKLENFVNDIGPKPSHGKRWTIDRINNNGNYEPQNVRWATYEQQACNKQMWCRR